MQKGQIQIILIGILVVAIALAGGLYIGRQTTPKPSPTPAPVVTQTPQPTSVPTTTDVSPAPNGTGASGVPSGTAETANWKTYTDKKGRFSFKIPQDWAVSQEFQPTQYLDVIEFHSGNYKVEKLTEPGIVDKELRSGEALRIRIEKNPNFKSSQDYNLFVKNTSTAYPLEAQKKAYETKVDGIEAIYTPEINLFDIQYAVEVFHNGYTYTLTFETLNSNKIFNQILSTFKFTP